MLNHSKVVDLTIPLDASIVMWPGAPIPEAETLVTIKHDGYFARKVSFFEHSGTHFDAPCHFVEGGRSVDQVPVDKLVADINTSLIAETALPSLTLVIAFPSIVEQIDTVLPNAVTA